MQQRRTSRWAVFWRLVAVLGSMGVVTLTILTSSRAAFVDTTTNGPNSLAAGTVDLRDDDGGSVAFDVSNLAPDDQVERCIRVTYDGSLPADVHLYGSGSGTLDGFLDMTVDIGTGGGFASCAGFTPGSNLHTGTLADFRSRTDFTNGLTGWNGATTGDDRTYRIRFTLQDDNGAQGNTSSVTLTWEAQNS